MLACMTACRLYDEEALFPTKPLGPDKPDAGRVPQDAAEAAEHRTRADSSIRDASKG